MLKRGGTYYLTYSAAGTENRTYAMGCYVGKSPLGPFVPQRRNPICPQHRRTHHRNGARLHCFRDRRMSCGRSTLFEQAWPTGLNAAWDGSGDDRQDGELFVPECDFHTAMAAREQTRLRPCSTDPGWLPLNQGMPNNWV